MNEKKITCPQIREIISTLEGHELKDKKNGHFKFPMYLNKTAKETDLEFLDLSIRSKHALMRAGYRTIADIMQGISGSSDLRRIRGCGTTSVEEIMEKLFVYQYVSLSPNGRKTFLNDVLKMNSN